MTPPSLAPIAIEAIQFTAVATGITVLPEEVPSLVTWVPAAAEASRAGRQSRASSGARVTVEFTARTPIPANSEVAVAYDLAINGRWRKCRGIPSFTHSTAHRGSHGTTYYYRLSQWIAAAHVMLFTREDHRHYAV